MDEPEVIEGLASEWDIVSDNVDTIVDTEGHLDILLLTYFNPDPSPFDNYFDILEITEEGDLEYSMGASEHSSNHLQYGLYEDWEYSPSFDHLTRLLILRQAKKAGLQMRLFRQMMPALQTSTLLTLRPILVMRILAK